MPVENMNDDISVIDVGSVDKSDVGLFAEATFPDNPPKKKLSREEKKANESIKEEEQKKEFVERKLDSDFKSFGEDVYNDYLKGEDIFGKIDDLDSIKFKMKLEKDYNVAISDSVTKKDDLINLIVKQ